MRTTIKVGLISLGVGFLLLVVLIALSLLFVIGTAPGVKTPLSSPLRELVSCLFTLGIYWFVFVVVGVVLIVYGLIQRIRDNNKDTDT